MDKNIERAIAGARSRIGEIRDQNRGARIESRRQLNSHSFLRKLQRLASSDTASIIRGAARKNTLEDQFRKAWDDEREARQKLLFLRAIEDLNFEDGQRAWILTAKIGENSFLIQKKPMRYTVRVNGQPTSDAIHRKAVETYSPIVDLVWGIYTHLEAEGN